MNQKTEMIFVRWGLHLGFAVALLAVLIFVQSVWLVSLKRERLESQNETQRIQQRMTQTEQITKEHTTLVAMMQALQNRADSIRARIPDRPNEGEFLEQTTNAAKDAGITIKEYRRGEIVFNGDHSKLQVHISLLGPYTSICKFIDRLEKMPRISRISKMKLKTDSSLDEAYPVDLTLTLFFRAEQSQERLARVPNGI